ncbi:MAG: GatB/YqeY domain-containing protein [Candidatus Sungbacteria bacterium]|nr:GatB/YqeY domain-containing protein [Candidatus Sungbacteria bacterium]
MKDKIQNDIKEAMRSKDELRLSVLRMLSSSIHNKELEKRVKSGKAEELSEEEVVAAIRSEVKKRRDAIIEFEKGGRQDLAEKESAEAKILEVYLPQEISDEEIEKVVKEVISVLGEVTIKDFGRVMQEAMKKVKGQAGGDRVSAAVKKIMQ